MRPTGENLTLTNGRCGPALMSAFIGGNRRANPSVPLRSETPASQQQSSGLRFDRAPPARDLPPKTREASARRRTTAPAARGAAGDRRSRDSVRPRGKAGHSGLELSMKARTTDAPVPLGRFRRAAVPDSAFAPPSLRRGSDDVATDSSSDAAASLASTNSSVPPSSARPMLPSDSDAAACASPSEY